MKTGAGRNRESVGHCGTNVNENNERMDDNSHGGSDDVDLFDANRAWPAKAKP